MRDQETSSLRDDELDATTGELELAERHALRRVAGLSTELADITEVEYRQLRLERVVLVGVWTEGTPTDAENSLAELAALAETAGSQVLDGADPAAQPARPGHLHRPRARSTSCATWCSATGADTVICDGELSPSQLRNLEERGQGQGHRPDRADPGHLRPARQEQGGQGAGRAGPAAVPAAAAARLG